MTLPQFARLVHAMRQAQKDYFKVPAPDRLQRAKRLESDVDRQLRLLLDIEDRPLLVDSPATAEEKAALAKQAAQRLNESLGQGRAIEEARALADYVESKYGPGVVPVFAKRPAPNSGQSSS